MSSPLTFEGSFDLRRLQAIQRSAWLRQPPTPRTSCHLGSQLPGPLRGASRGITRDIQPWGLHFPPACQRTWDTTKDRSELSITIRQLDAIHEATRVALYHTLHCSYSGTGSRHLRQQQALESHEKLVIIAARYSNAQSIPYLHKNRSNFLYTGKTIVSPSLGKSHFQTYFCT